MVVGSETQVFQPSTPTPEEEINLQNFKHWIVVGLAFLSCGLLISGMLRDSISLLWLGIACTLAVLIFESYVGWTSCSSGPDKETSSLNSSTYRGSSELKFSAAHI